MHRGPGLWLLLLKTSVHQKRWPVAGSGRVCFVKAFENRAMEQGILEDKESQAGDPIGSAILRNSKEAETSMLNFCMKWSFRVLASMSHPDVTPRPEALVAASAGLMQIRPRLLFWNARNNSSVSNCHDQIQN